MKFTRNDLIQVVMREGCVYKLRTVLPGEIQRNSFIIHVIGIGKDSYAEGQGE